MNLKKQQGYLNVKNNNNINKKYNCLVNIFNFFILIMDYKKNGV